MKYTSLVIAPAALLLVGSMNVQADSWLDSVTNFFKGEAEQVSDSVKEVGTDAGQRLADSGKSAVNSLTAQSKDKAANALSAIGLVTSLTEQLGITPEQASAGLGALLGQAKTNLNEQQMTDLKSAIPNMDQLIANAPAVAEGKSAVGGLLAKAGELTGSATELGAKLEGAGQTMQQFQAAGLDPSMITKFIEVTKNFLTQSGETQLAESISSL